MFVTSEWPLRSGSRSDGSLTSPHRYRCLFSHSIKDYLATKPRDIHFPRPPLAGQQGSIYEVSLQEREAYLDELYLTTPPFVTFSHEEKEEDAATGLDLSTVCPVLASQRASSTKEALCYAGWTCRFLGRRTCRWHCSITRDEKFRTARA